MNTYFLLINFLLLLAAAGGIYGLINYKYIRKAYVWLSIFLIVSALLQFCGTFLSALFKTNELYHTLINPIYYLLIYLIFSNITQSKKSLKIINALFIFGSIPLLIYSIKSINAGLLAIEAISIGNFVYSIACMILFLDMIKDTVTKSPFKMSKFYVLTAFLFYHSAILFFWTAKRFYFDQSMSQFYDYLNIFMLFIYYTTLFVALIVEKKSGIQNES